MIYLIREDREIIANGKRPNYAEKASFSWQERSGSGRKKERNY
jgi:hypothetical protein